MERIDELIKIIGQARGLADMQKEEPKTTPTTQLTAVREETFSLNFESQEGAKIGPFDVAYKAINPLGKWTSAYNILKQSNASINARYHGKGYVYAYWLYGQDRIYRQKLKPKD
jgi:hypothetical protein